MEAAGGERRMTRSVARSNVALDFDGCCFVPSDPLLVPPRMQLFLTLWGEHEDTDRNRYTRNPGDRREGP